MVKFITFAWILSFLALANLPWQFAESPDDAKDSFISQAGTVKVRLKLFNNEKPEAEFNCQFGLIPAASRLAAAARHPTRSLLGTLCENGKKLASIEPGSLSGGAMGATEFEFKEVPAGSYVVFATRFQFESLSFITQFNVVVASGETKTVELEETAAVVTLRTTRDGKPASGEKISLVPVTSNHTPEPLVLEAVADAEGVATFESPAPASYVACSSAELIPSQSASLIKVQAPLGLRAFSVHKYGAVDLRHEINRADTTRLRVKFTPAKPLSLITECSLFGVGDSCRSLAQRGLGVAPNDFDFGVVPLGEYVVCFATKENPNEGQAQISVNTAISQTATVAVNQCEVSGSVSTPAGVKLSDVRVQLIVNAPWRTAVRNAMFEATPDAKGKFVIANAYTGNYVIQAVGRDTSGAVNAVACQTLKVEKAIKNVKLSMSGKVGSILLESELPKGNEVLFWTPSYVLRDAKGAEVLLPVIDFGRRSQLYDGYKIEGVPEGLYTLDLTSHPFLGGKPIEIKVPAKTVSSLKLKIGESEFPRSVSVLSLNVDTWTRRDGANDFTVNWEAFDAEGKTVRVQSGVLFQYLGNNVAKLTVRIFGCKPQDFDLRELRKNTSYKDAINLPILALPCE